MLDTLIYSLYNCAKSIYNLTHQIPKYIEYNPTNDNRIGNSLSIPIGEGTKGVISLNINQSTPHTYLVGSTGSGKSNLLKVILSTVINNYHNVKLILCDYKRCELSIFKDCTNVLSFSYTEEDISNTINSTYQMVLDKYDKLMQQNKCQCSSYEETILLVIEEVALMPKSDMKILRKLMSISRAVNVYVLFTCQRPSNEVLDNVVKSLVANRIVLKVEDKKNSVIALDEVGAENLKGNGHGIIKSNGYRLEFQGYYIKDNTLFNIIKANAKPKTITTDNSNSKAKNINNTDTWIDKL